jgi:hypothetical protein
MQILFHTEKDDVLWRWLWKLYFIPNNVISHCFVQVFIIDPLEKDSRELLKIAEAFYVHSVPVRIGLVFAVNSAKEVCGYDDPAVALAYAFDYIRQEEDPPKALTFITDVSPGFFYLLWNYCQLC